MEQGCIERNLILVKDEEPFVGVNHSYDYDNDLACMLLQHVKNHLTQVHTPLAFNASRPLDKEL